MLWWFKRAQPLTASAFRSGGRFPLTSQETTNAIVCAKDNALKLFDEATQVNDDRTVRGQDRSIESKKTRKNC